MRTVRRARHRNGCIKHALAPCKPLALIQPNHPLSYAPQSGIIQKLVQQFMNSPLKRAVFGAESVRLNLFRQRRHAREQIVRLHPPGQPCLQLRLPPKFIYEVTVVVDHGAVANHIRSVPRSVKLRGNLRVQNPQLALERRRCVHGKGRPPRHFRNQFHVFARFLHPRADFIRERGLSHAVRTDEREFQTLPPFVVITVSNTVPPGRKSVIRQ